MKRPTQMPRYTITEPGNCAACRSRLRPGGYAKVNAVGPLCWVCCEMGVPVKTP